MTKKQFMAALAKTPRDWYLTPMGRLRRDAPIVIYDNEAAEAVGDDDGKLTRFCRCPITAVHAGSDDNPTDLEELIDTDNYGVAGDQLDMADVLQTRIALSADNEVVEPGFDAELRAELLVACGLAA